MQQILHILSLKMGDREVRQILDMLVHNDALKHDVYQLMFSSDAYVAAHAAWVLTRMPKQEVAFLQQHQNEIIDNVMAADANISLQRLSLNLLNNQMYVADDLRADFIDFCLVGMMAAKNPSGLRAVFMKVAYRQCRLIPELLSEFLTYIDMAKSSPMEPAISCTVKNILKEIANRRTI